MIRESLNEKIIKTVERAKFRTKQKIEYLRWEAEHLQPLLNEFLDKATLPEPPSETVVDVTWENEVQPKPKSRRRAARSR